MHWVERDGVRIPRPVGGHVGLDLCNTRAGWGSTVLPGEEWLTGYESLAAWAGHVGLLDAAEEARLRRRSGSRTDDVLTDVRRLRTLVRAAVLDPADARALAGVSGYVRRAALGLVLRAGQDGAPTRVVTSPREVELPLLRVAWAAGELLDSGQLDRVAECGGTRCGWLFLNPTGRRRWCSMSSCGNRAKVAAFAARQKNDS